MAKWKRPYRNGQTGRGISIGEMELEKGSVYHNRDNFIGA